MVNYIKIKQYSLVIRKKSEYSREVGRMKKMIHSAWEEEEKDDGIYSEGFRESLVEDGEIDSWGAAFMSGYDEAG